MPRRSYLIAAVLACGTPALAAELPFEGGFYVPADLANTCGEPNYEVYDWVLGFNSKKATFGDSDGVCELKSIKFDKASSTYQTSWSCRSTGGDDSTKMAITTDGAKGKIKALDGKPYVFCEAFP